MKNQNQAKVGNAPKQEELKPLLNRLDKICSRLELMEAVAELLYVWKNASDREVKLTTHSVAVLGNFFREESYEIRHEIGADIMDRLTVIGNRKEVSNG